MAYTMFDDAAYEVQKEMRRKKQRAFWANVKHFYHRTIARSKRPAVISKQGLDELQEIRCKAMDRIIIKALVGDKTKLGQ